MASHNGPQPARSSQYYSDTIIFQVEDTLFRVPKHYFAQHSSIFSDMFSAPQTGSGTQDGSSDENPLKLEGIQKQEFECLLSVMYPPQPFDTGSSLNTDQWISILKLTTMWCFHYIRKHAVDKLTTLDMDPIDRVLLAKQYNISAWFGPGCRALIQREDFLSIEESQKIGWHNAIHLFQAREQYTRGGRRPLSLESIFLSIFQAEMSSLDEEHQYFMASALPPLIPNVTNNPPELLGPAYLSRKRIVFL